MVADSRKKDEAVSSLAAQVREATGQSVFSCYQCGKCSGGCPLAAEMDVPPSSILRLLQLGFSELDDTALGALSIWLCLTCETCVARCPQEVDLPRVMDFLRQESVRRGRIHPKAGDVLAFHRSFLDSIRLGGRLHEASLIGLYKLRTGHLLQDVGAVPSMLKRGKLRLLPPRIRGRRAVARIMRRAMAATEAGSSKTEATASAHHGEKPQ